MKNVIRPATAEDALAMTVWVALPEGGEPLPAADDS